MSLGHNSYSENSVNGGPIHTYKGYVEIKRLQNVHIIPNINVRWPAIRPLLNIYKHGNRKPLNAKNTIWSTVLAKSKCSFWETVSIVLWFRVDMVETIWRWVMIVGWTCSGYWDSAYIVEPNWNQKVWGPKNIWESAAFERGGTSWCIYVVKQNHKVMKQLWE